MNAVEGNAIAEIFQAIVLVFAFVLGGGNEPARIDLWPLSKPTISLPVAFVAGTDRFDPIALAAFEQGVDETGRPMVFFSLAEQDRAGFAGFTARHLGASVDMMVCDTVVVSPVIHAVISGQFLMLSGQDVWAVMAGFIANGCP